MMHNGAMNGILFCQASEYGAENHTYLASIRKRISSDYVMWISQTMMCVEPMFNVKFFNAQQRMIVAELHISCRPSRLH